MKRKLHTAEQIVNKLRQADAAIASGGTVEEVCKQLGISEATYYNWRRQYGQMKLDQVKQLKSLVPDKAVGRSRFTHASGTHHTHRTKAHYYKKKGTQEDFVARTSVVTAR